MVFMPQKDDNKIIPCNNFIGNIIPLSWYKDLKTHSGRPDHTAISILAEIIYWYKPNSQNLSKFKGDSWQTSYNHFEHKFNTSKESVRRALVRLEKLDIIRRELRTITVRGQRYNNVLFIHLNKSNVFCTPIHKNTEASPQIKGDIYRDYEENNKNRYLKEDESNFEIIVSSNATNRVCSKKQHSLVVQRSKKLNEETIEPDFVKASLPLNDVTYERLSTEQSFSQTVPFSIDYFLPLTEADNTKLTERVGKEFGLTFINALAKKLGLKYPSYRFKDKNKFLNYMIKALEHELHIPEKVNNLNFAYANNDESYLTKIELSTDVSLVGKVKRRIAQEIESSLARKILQKCYFPTIEKNTTNYKIYINDTSLSLNETIQEKLKNIIYEVSQGLDFHTNKLLGITTIDFIQGKKVSTFSASEMSESSLKCLNQSTSPVWTKAREKLTKLLGEGVDRSWFSHIDFEYDVDSGRVCLLFQSEFRKDYVDNNYGSHINSVLKHYIKDLREIIYKVKGSLEENIVWRSNEYTKETRIKYNTTLSTMNPVNIDIDAIMGTSYIL